MRKILSIGLLLLGCTIGYSQSFTSIDSLLLSLKKPADKTDRFKTLTRLCFEFRLTRPDSAIKYGSEAIAIGKELGYKSELSRPYNFLGLTYAYQSEFLKAHENLENALRLCEQAGDETEIAHTYNNMGRLYLQLRDTAEARQYINKALPKFVQLKNKSGEAWVYRNLAEYFDQRNLLDTALLYSTRALDIRGTLPDRGNLITALTDIAFLEKKANDYVQAKKYLTQADNIAIGLNDPYRLQDVRINLIEVLVETEDLPALANELEVLENLLRTYPNNFLESRFELLTAKTSLLNKRDAQAETMLKKIVADQTETATSAEYREALSLLAQLAKKNNRLADAEIYALMQKNANERMANQSIRLELARADFKTNLQQIQNANQELQFGIEQKNLVIIFISIGGTIAVLILIAIVNALRKRRRVEQKLAAELHQASLEQRTVKDELELLVSSLDDIVFELDTEMRYRNVWIRDESRLFIPKEVFLGKTMQEVFGQMPWFLNLMEGAIKEAIATRLSVTVEYQLDNAWFSAKISSIIKQQQVTGMVILVNEITKQKNIQEALVQNEKKYRLLSENMSDLVVIAELGGNFKFLSQAAIHFFGIPAEELVGKNIYSFVHPDDILFLQTDAHARAAPGESLQNVQFRILHTKGTVVWVEVATRPWTEDGVADQPLVQAVVRDITVRKKAEEQLADSERKYRVISENSADVIAVFNHAGKHIFISPSIETVLGYTPDEWTTLTPFSAIHPDDLHLHEGLREKFNNGERVNGLQFRLKKKSGVYAWMEANYAPVSDSQTQAITIYSSMRDISIRKQALEKLAESESLYRLLSENTHDLICLHNPDGTYRFVSSSVHDLLGFEPDELIGLSPYTLIHPDDHERLRTQPHQKTLEGNAIRNIEYRIRRKDGSYIWMDTHTNPVMENGAVISFQTSSRDITLRIELENGLKDARAKAEEASRYKSEFLSSMSHEIRTPLNAIVGLSSILLMRDPQGEQLKIYKMLKNSGDNLLALVTDILDFSKIEAGRMELEKVDFSLSETMHDTVKLFHEKALAKGLVLTLDFDDRIPAFVSGDQVKLRQIVSNLISNALKFTERGVVRVKIEQTERKQKLQHIRFSVQDSGIGIDSDKLITIFESFSQAGRDTSRKYGGTGLGLAISQNLVKLMNGKLEVKSKIGEGSLFYFTVQLEEASYEDGR